MAWLATYGASNKIVDSEDSYDEFLYYGAISWSRTISTERYRYVGMTEAAADTCFAALNNPPTVIATKKRENNAGAYMVEVTEVTEGAWSP